MERICDHNPGVICDRKKCYHCGWHPEVAERRIEKIKEERNELDRQSR